MFVWVFWVFTTALERFFLNGNLLHHSKDTTQKISQTSTSSPSSFFIRCTFFTFTTTQPSITECLMIELDFRRIYEGILFVLLFNFLIQNTSIMVKSYFLKSVWLRPAQMRSYFAQFLFKIKSSESQELKKQRFDFEIPDNGDVIIAGEGLENVGVCSLPETNKRH